MEKSLLTKRTFNETVSTTLLQELQNTEINLQNEYRNLLQTSRELSEYIIRTRIIVKNIMIAVPRWTANIKVILELSETTHRIVIQELDKELLVTNTNVPDLQEKNAKIKEINQLLQDNIKTLTMQKKNIYILVKNLMYAHFKINMPKSTSSSSSSSISSCHKK